jgi:bacterioferritin-associated ferredoxin
LTIILNKSMMQSILKTQSTAPAMFVCLCHNVTDGQIRQTMRERGFVSLREVREHLGVGSQCGRCAQCARQVIATELERQCAVQSGRRCMPIAVAA